MKDATQTTFSAEQLAERRWKRGHERGRRQGRQRDDRHVKGQHPEACDQPGRNDQHPHRCQEGPEELAVRGDQAPFIKTDPDVDREDQREHNVVADPDIIKIHATGSHTGHCRCRVGQHHHAGDCLPEIKIKARPDAELGDAECRAGKDQKLLDLPLVPLVRHSTQPTHPPGAPGRSDYGTDRCHQPAARDAQ